MMEREIKQRVKKSENQCFYQNAQCVAVKNEIY